MNRRSHLQTQNPPSNFGNLTYNEELPDYYGEPVEEVQRVSGILYDRHETNRIAFEELQLAADLDLQKIRSEHPDDVKIIEDNIAKIQNTITTYAEGGNFHNAGKVLSKTYREYIGNQDRASAIKAREAQIANMQAIDEMEGWSQQEKQLAKAKANSLDYNRSVADGGFIGWKPNEHVNTDTLIDSFFKDWYNYKDSMSGINMRPDGTINAALWNIAASEAQPYLEKFSQSIGGLDRDKVVSTLYNFLSNNDQYVNYMDSKYEMSRFDPQSGTTKAISEADLLPYFMASPTDEKGNPKDMNGLVIEAKLATQGAITELKEQHRATTGQELDDTTAMSELHRRNYLHRNVIQDISGLAGKYSHTVIEYDHQIKEHYLHKYFLEKNEDRNIALMQLGALPINYEFDKVYSDLQNWDKEVDELNLIINNRRGELMNTPDIPENRNKREGLIRDIKNLEARHAKVKTDRDRLESTFRNIAQNVSNDDIDRVLNDNLANMFSSHAGMRTVIGALLDGGDKDMIYNLLRTGDREGLKDLILARQNSSHNKTLKFFSRIRGEDFLERGREADENRAIRLANSAISNFYKSVQTTLGPEKFAMNRNVHSVIPQENTATYRYANEVLDQAKRKLLTFSTIDNRSSSSNEIQEVINAAVAVDLSTITDIKEGNLRHILTYADKDGNRTQYIIDSPYLDNTTAGAVADDLIRGSQNPLNSPGDRQNLYMAGTAMHVSNLRTNTGAGFYEEVNKYNLELMKVDGRQRVATNPITVQAYGNDYIFVVDKVMDGSYQVLLKNKEGEEYPIRYYLEKKEPNSFTTMELEQGYASPQDASNDIYRLIFNR